MSIEVTRRNFLAGMAGAGALAAVGLAGCSSGGAESQAAAPAGESGTQAIGSAEPAFLTAPDPIPDSEIAETIECELVICGAGICGLPAAMLAAENGADVHVLEKGSTYGLFRLCTAGFNSDLQKRYDLTTDRKEFVTSTWAITNGVQGRMSSYGLWFDNSAEYINWLEKIFNDEGYQLVPAASLEYKITNDGIGMAGANPLWQAFSQMIFFAHEDGSFFATGNPVDWTGVMEKYATEHGATFHYNSPAVQLIRDSDGRCSGVIAKNENEEYVRYNASKGVLLTTGDMGADHEMMEYYNRSLSKIIRYNVNANDTGDGQKMGMWIGADMDEFACGDLWPFAAVMMDGTLPDFLDGTHFYAGVASVPGVMVVDGAGRRLMAETLPFQSPSIPKLTCTPDGCAWSIWDSAWEEKWPKDGYMVEDYTASNTQKEVDMNVEKGLTFKFDTLDELAEHCGFDKEMFTASINRYNELCELGEDLDFYKDAVWMTGIDTPPYYASKHCSSMTSTRGGLKNDERCRVLDKEGKPIPGLYAAGNTAGSFYGSVYPPNVMGSGIGHGQCFSWLAVKDILGLDYIHSNI